MRLRKRFLACTLTCALIASLPGTVQASNIAGLQQQVDKNQNNLNKINNQLSKYEAELDEALTTLDDQKSEMTNLMQEIVYIEDAISQKQHNIDQATIQLEEANGMREEQYEAMMIRIQYMYERGTDNYLQMLFGSHDFADFLNRAEYVDSLYEYDSNMLAGYEQLVSDIDTMRHTLEQDKMELEAEHDRLDEHQYELERIMSDLEDKIADYDDLVASTKEKAKQYKNQIDRDKAQIAQLKAQEEANKKPAAGNGSSNITVSGSGTGADIAKFALQYVGYPYVYGGNSLTNGVDCSGFIVQVYKAHGYSLGARTSLGMRKIGTEVSLADAQAGDIICYSGHVALYIGDGMIVHAKNSKYGIVTDPVYYGWGGTGPAVLTVRRIIN